MNFTDMLRQLPDDALVPVAWVRAQLADTRIAESAAPNPLAVTETTWRERLWTCAPATRLTVDEIAEATGRPPSWVYRHTSPKSGLDPLPHRKQDGALVFLASEIRQWLDEHEEIIVRPATPVVPITRRAKR